MKKVLMGNHAVAYGVLLAKVEVISAYPITPQTTIVEKLSDLCAKGKLNARLIDVESEHSAMAGCIGASAAGVRTFTATSSQGLALMHELLHWAAGARLPIVMANVNRAMGPPWNIWTDQNDSLSQRDTGWMQFYCESNQEVLDTMIQAFKISERVLLPSMILLDGFFLSHTSEPVDIPDQEKVDSYLPEYKPTYKLDVKFPLSFGNLTDENYYYELRYKMQEAMEKAKNIAKEVDAEFLSTFGRGYGVVESYKCDNADLILVTSGTISSTTRVVIDKLRDKGKKIGMLKIKMFRPFPIEDVRMALENAKKVAVIDRNISFGNGGIFSQEVKSAMYNIGNHIPIFGYIAGLGGRDVTPMVIEDIIDFTMKHDRPKDDIHWVGLKI